MDIKHYLRIENNTFGFLLRGYNEIKKTDIELTTSEYDKFFELQREGKQFRLKKTPTGTGLFDYIEEYIPEPVPSTPTETELLREEVLEQSEYMVEMDYRLMNLELGL